MSTTTFVFQFVKVVQVKVDDDLQDILTDEWRSTFYNIHTLKELAHHIAWNRGVKHWDVEGLYPGEHEKFEILSNEWDDEWD